MTNLPKHTHQNLVEQLSVLPVVELINLLFLLSNPTERVRGAWSKTALGDFFSIRYRPSGQKNGTTLGPRELVLGALEEVLPSRVVINVDPPEPQFERLLRSIRDFVAAHRPVLLTTVAAILAIPVATNLGRPKSEPQIHAPLKLGSADRQPLVHELSDAGSSPSTSPEVPPQIAIPAQVESVTSSEPYVAPLGRGLIQRPAWARGRLAEVFFGLVRHSTVTVSDADYPDTWGMNEAVVARGDLTAATRVDGDGGLLQTLGLGDTVAVITDRTHTRSNLLDEVARSLGTEVILGLKSNGSQSVVFSKVPNARQLAEAIALIGGAPGSADGAYLPFLGAFLRCYTTRVAIEERPERGP